jgi:hypothetical protein
MKCENLKYVLRFYVALVISHSKKRYKCQRVEHLICWLVRRTFRIRSPRITVLYLQGEGRYWNVRPGTSLLFLQLNCVSEF